MSQSGVCFEHFVALFRMHYVTRFLRWLYKANPSSLPRGSIKIIIQMVEKYCCIEWFMTINKLQSMIWNITHFSSSRQVKNQNIVQKVPEAGTDEFHLDVILVVFGSFWLFLFAVSCVKSVNLFSDFCIWLVVCLTADNI